LKVIRLAIRELYETIDCSLGETSPINKLRRITRMNKYGQAAISAIKLIENKQALTPIDAWSISTSAIFGKGTSSQKKGCPKSAFIGLCEVGLVLGIPQGSYAERDNSQINKEYAIKAVELLRMNPGLVNYKRSLWEAVMNGEVKQHNSQMDVVLALWENGLIT
jgi:hypothetical protein